MMRASTSSATTRTLTPSSSFTSLQELELLEAQRQEEEERDMMKTLDLLKLAEEEDARRNQDEDDMSKTLMFLSQALSDGEIGFLQGTRPAGRFVHFAPTIKVLFLPSEERVDARQARKRFWEAGPFHDELWDGETGSFRETELTTEELAMLLRRTSKTNVTGKIKSFFRGRTLNIDAKAHANKVIEEDDADSGTLALTRPASAATVEGMKEKRRSSSRLLSFITRRRSTKTPPPTQGVSESAAESAMDPDGQNWLAQVMEESENLDDIGEAVEETEVQ